MADDSNLRINFEVANVSAIPDAINQAATAAASGSAQITSSFEEASEAAAAMAEEFASATQQGTELEREFSSLGTAAGKAVPPTVIPPNVPVDVENLNAGLEKLANTITRRLVFAELIRGLRYIPAAIQDVIGALTGWDDEAQKTEETMEKLNQSVYSDVEKAAVIMAKARDGETAGAQIKAEQITKDLEDQRAKVSAIQAEQDAIVRKNSFLALPPTAQAAVAEYIGSTKEQILAIDNTRTHEEELRKAYEAAVEAESKLFGAKTLADAELFASQVKDNVKASKAQAQEDKHAETAASKLWRFKIELINTFERKAAELTKKQEAATAEEERLATEAYIAKLSYIKSLDSASNAFNKSEEKGAERAAEATREALAGNLDAAADLARGEETMAKAGLAVNQKLAEDVIALTKQRVDIELETEESALDKRFKLHQISAQRFSQEETAAIQKWYNFEKKMIDDSTNNWAQHEAKVEKLDAKRAQMMQQTANKIETQEQKTMNLIDRNFNTNIDKWIRGQESFGKAMTQSWQSIELGVINSLLKMGEQFVIQTALGATLGKMSIAQSAGKAYAAAVASVFEALPFPANVAAAPAAGASASAETEAGDIFQRGGVVPKDQNAQLHAKEMVLPAPLSTAFQDMVARGAGGGGHGPTAVHVHYANNGPASSAMQQADIAKAVRTGIRKGSIKLKP